MASFSGPMQSFGSHLHLPAWIKNYPPVGKRYVTILTFLWSAYITPQHLQSHARFTANYLNHYRSPNAALYLYKFESRVIFGIILTIVKQLGTKIKQHDDLIQLLLALRNVPLPKNVLEQIPVNSEDRTINKDLKCFIEVFSDLERDAPLHPPPQTRSMTTGPNSSAKPRPLWRNPPDKRLTGREWQNLNVFVARLHFAAPDVDGLDVRGLSVMVQALEQPLLPNHLEDVLLAAAAWVIYAGQRMMDYTHVPNSGYGDDEPVNRVAGVL